MVPLRVVRAVLRKPGLLDFLHPSVGGLWLLSAPQARPCSRMSRRPPASSGRLFRQATGIGLTKFVVGREAYLGWAGGVALRFTAFTFDDASSDLDSIFSCGSVSHIIDT